MTAAGMLALSCCKFKLYLPADDHMIMVAMQGGMACDAV